MNSYWTNEAKRQEGGEEEINVRAAVIEGIDFSPLLRGMCKSKMYSNMRLRLNLSIFR